MTNEEVLRRARTKRWIIQTVAKRQVYFFGHVMKIEQLVAAGKIIGKRSRGRQPRKITDQSQDWTMTSSTYDVFQRARERNLMVADVFGHGTSSSIKTNRNIFQFTEEFFEFFDVFSWKVL